MMSLSDTERLLEQAIRGAFEEGYLQGVAHSRFESIHAAKARMSAAYWTRVREQAESLFTPAKR